MIRTKALLLLTLSGSCAFADLAFTLAPGSQLANRDAETIFSATLTNTGSADIFLNDISVSFSSPAATSFTVDRNFFFESVPGVLAPGETYSGPVFRISISKPPSGSYTGLVSILGGADIFSQANLPAVNFTVQVVHRPPKPIR